MSNITPLFPDLLDRPGHDRSGRRASPPQVAFARDELAIILGLYGRMVAGGIWRDYALSFTGEAAVFSGFTRTADRPDVQIVKRPALARKQGAFALIGQNGSVLKRGHELAPLVRLLDRRLLKLVED